MISMNLENIHKNRSPFTCFALTFTLSIPFWIAGALTTFQILPGIPLSALGLLCMVVWGQEQWSELETFKGQMRTRQFLLLMMRGDEIH